MPRPRRRLRATCEAANPPEPGVRGVCELDAVPGARTDEHVDRARDKDRNRWLSRPNRPGTAAPTRCTFQRVRMWPVGAAGQGPAGCQPLAQGQDKR
jgi:hypothetical protein